MILGMGVGQKQDPDHLEALWGLNIFQNKLSSNNASTHAWDINVVCNIKIGVQHGRFIVLVLASVARVVMSVFDFWHPLDTETVRMFASLVEMGKWLGIRGHETCTLLVVAPWVSTVSPVSQVLQLRIQPAANQKYSGKKICICTEHVQTLVLIP